MKIKNIVELSLGLMATVIFPNYDAIAAGSATVNLGTAGNFVILSKAGISTTGTTAIVGDIGVSPIKSTAITGFALTLPPASAFSTSAQVTGKVYAPDYASPTPANLTTAVLDMQTAYTSAGGRAPTVTDLEAGDIGGLTLVSGVYKWSTGVTIPTDVTLTGGANDVWIFQISQTLTVSSGVHVTLSGGAQAQNIFWQVAGQTTIGSTAVFNGNILDQTAIVLNTGATLNGRALAQTAVTLDSNPVTIPTAVAVGGQNQQVRMYIIPVFGPQSADSTFTSWANGVVSNIYNGTVPGTNLGHYLDTSYFGANVSQSPFTNDTVRFAVHVVAANPGYMFSPNDLTFTEKSTDSNKLNYSFVYTNPAPSYYAYSPSAMGVVRGLDGSVSAVYTNSENWSNLVSEFIFIGPKSDCYAYGTNGGLNYSYSSLSNYLDSAGVDVTGTWSLDDGTTNSIVSASKTFYRQGTPSQLDFLGITSVGGQTYDVSFVSSTNDTWTVQASPTLGSSAVWIDVFTASGMGNALWLSTTNTTCFLRAVLQQ